MEIVEKDFVMTPSSFDSDRFDLRFFKRVKKRDTGKFETELGDPLYGLTLASAIRRIAHKRTAAKYEEANVTLFEYLKELNSNYEKMVKLCKESLPEKFDTGD